MRLTELNPRLKENILVFDCPCGRCNTEKMPQGRIRIPIVPAPNGWTMSGEFPETISLQPSIRIGDERTDAIEGCCIWHGYLTNGSLVPC